MNWLTSELRSLGGDLHDDAGRTQATAAACCGPPDCGALGADSAHQLVRYLTIWLLHRARLLTSDCRLVSAGSTCGIASVSCTKADDCLTASSSCAMLG